MTAKGVEQSTPFFMYFSFPNVYFTLFRTIPLKQTGRYLNIKNINKKLPILPIAAVAKSPNLNPKPILMTMMQMVCIMFSTYN